MERLKDRFARDRVVQEVFTITIGAIFIIAAMIRLIHGKTQYDNIIQIVEVIILFATLLSLERLLRKGRYKPHNITLVHISVIELLVIINHLR